MNYDLHANAIFLKIANWNIIAIRRPENAFRRVISVITFCGYINDVLNGCHMAAMGCVCVLEFWFISMIVSRICMSDLSRGKKINWFECPGRLNRGSVMHSFCIVFHVSMSKLLNKQSSGQYLNFKFIDACWISNLSVAQSQVKSSFIFLLQN